VVCVVQAAAKDAAAAGERAAAENAEVANRAGEEEWSCKDGEAQQEACEAAPGEEGHAGGEAAKSAAEEGENGAQTTTVGQEPGADSTAGEARRSASESQAAADEAAEEARKKEEQAERGRALAAAKLEAKAKAGLRILMLLCVLEGGAGGLHAQHGGLGDFSVLYTNCKSYNMTAAKWWGRGNGRVFSAEAIAE
jgi:hypothetical protein